MSVVPALQRSFQQQPLAHDTELQSGDPPPPPALELLLAPVLELLLAPVLLAPDVDDAVELLELVLPPLPPDPVPGSPFPPPEIVSKSAPVAHATSTRVSIENHRDFFIWAPWGPRRC
jgi:hypothetical protein